MVYELKKKVLFSDFPSFTALQQEHIFSCYSLLQEIEMGKSETPKQLISPNLSLSDTSSSIDVDEGSCTSVVGNKRRFIYNDSDEVCQSAKICHR